MTSRAIVVKVVLRMIWFNCRSEISRMTREAIRGRRHIAGRVAGDATRRRVGAGQCKARGRVIKRRGLPGGRIVAIRAVVIEIILLVIRFSCGGKVPLVAREACRRCVRIAARMAA